MSIKKIIIPIIFFIFYFFLSCEKFPPGDTQSESDNNPPNTSLANIPREGATLYALVSLNWDGEDDDGYIDYYEYRYTTEYLVSSDDDTGAYFFTSTDANGQIITTWWKIDSTMVQDWKSLTETNAVVAFNSLAVLNHQLFEVRAVDNSGNVDESPAFLNFFTNQTQFPKTEITSPLNNTDFLAKPEVDDWYKGIPITFTADDPDGNITEYAWRVDNGPWNWTTDTSVIIPPNAWAEPLEEEHIITVISRDDTYLIDPVGDSIEVEIYVPTFEKDILILDGTIEDVSLPNFDGLITDQMTDSAYYEIFGGNRGDLIVDDRDFARRRFPNFRTIRKYKMVVWIKDHFATVPYFAEESRNLEAYLHAGGKLVMIGSNIMQSFMDESYYLIAPCEPCIVYPAKFSSSGWNWFMNKILHVNFGYIGNLIGNFNSADGINGYSGIQLRPDTTKIANVFPQYNKLSNVDVIIEPGGFTVPILKLNSDDDYVDQEACGIRYYGSGFDVIYIGAPIWHMQSEDAKILGDKILEDMGF